MSARIVSVNVSTDKGTAKSPVAQAWIDPLGLRGDAHAGPWHRQVSMLASESMVHFAARLGRAPVWGEFGENLTTAGIDLSAVCVLDRITAGDAELEVTQLGKRCHGAGCAIFNEVGDCIMPKEGIFLRVVRGGQVRAGDPLRHRERPLRILIVTASDRAAAGVSVDQSGPRAQELVAAHLAPTRWRPDFRREIVPDEPAALRSLLITARDDGVDFVFTTGGTGAGPRDITPDVVVELADMLLPGIMEQVRQKYAAANPAALLSRAVAAVMGKTIVYTLPGSPRAVEEYLAEILKTSEHLLLMVHGSGH